jgi:TonB family protein
MTRVAENSDVDEKVYTGREVTRKVRLLSKPGASYVGHTGVVVLKAVFGSSGKVTKIDVVSGTPELAEVCIKAARQITFEPAIKDGRFVSMWMQLEYNFN